MPESDAFTQESNQNQLQEEYLKALDEKEEGGLIEGEVIQVDDEFVFIDVGLKSDGKIPVEEFKVLPAVGEIAEVVLVKREDRNGNVVVSKRKADLKVFWKTLREASENDEPVEGKVSKTVKGGFEIDLGYGITAFCPISKMDVQRIETPEDYVEVPYRFCSDEYAGGLPSCQRWDQGADSYEIVKEIWIMS